eukprot:526297-Rhodomonas_salina.1
MVTAMPALHSRKNLPAATHTLILMPQSLTKPYLNAQSHILNPHKRSDAKSHEQNTTFQTTQTSVCPDSGLRGPSLCCADDQEGAASAPRARLQPMAQPRNP